MNGPHAAATKSAMSRSRTATADNVHTPDTGSWSQLTLNGKDELAAPTVLISNAFNSPEATKQGYANANAQWLGSCVARA